MLQSFDILDSCAIHKQRLILNLVRAASFGDLGVVMLDDGPFLMSYREERAGLSPYVVVMAKVLRFVNVLSLSGASRKHGS